MGAIFYVASSHLIRSSIKSSNKDISCAFRDATSFQGFGNLVERHAEIRTSNWKYEQQQVIYQHIFTCLDPE